MAGWRFEAVKFFGYLIFPIIAFSFFNHPKFYKDELERNMEIAVKGINVEHLETLERLRFKEGIDKLNSTIEELDDKGKNKKPAATATSSDKSM